MERVLEEGEQTLSMGIEDIQRILPHRYPMLLLDRLEDIIPGVSAVGIKNVTVNEPFFLGHFPGRPVLPGIAVVESIGQAGALMIYTSLTGDFTGKFPYFMAIKEAKFRRPILPGDQMRIHVKKVGHHRKAWRLNGKVMVNDVLCAEATVTAMLIES